jgi:uncharacterized integral membrane protein
MMYMVVAALAVAVAVFVMQNTATVSVRFLVWEIERLSLAAVILFSLGVGVVLVGVPLWWQRWQLRGRVRALERQVAAAALPPEPGAPDG